MHQKTICEFWYVRVKEECLSLVEMLHVTSSLTSGNETTANIKRVRQIPTI
jgi:hypothetical protein